MLRWLRWGLASVPHRGDTGYSAEKAALPPAQLSNCHQQRPPQRLSLSTSQRANCPLLCVLWTSSRDPLSPVRTPNRLPVRSPPSPSLPLQTLPAWTFRPPKVPVPGGGYIPLPLSLATTDPLDLTHRIMLDLPPAFFPRYLPPPFSLSKAAETPFSAKAHPPKRPPPPPPPSP